MLEEVSAIKNKHKINKGEWAYVGWASILNREVRIGLIVKVKFKQVFEK